jgi:hypothetical protein
MLATGLPAYRRDDEGVSSTTIESDQPRVHYERKTRMMTKTEPRITFEQLAPNRRYRTFVYGLIEAGHFKSDGPLKKGPKETLAVEDAVVLRASVKLLTTLININLLAASFHANKIREAKRGEKLVVAMAPAARLFNIAVEAHHHAPSDTYGTVMRDIPNALSEEVEDVAIIDIEDLRRGVLSLLTEPSR